MKRYEVTWPAAFVLACVLAFIIAAHALHAPPVVIALAGVLGSAVMAFAKQLVSDTQSQGSTIPPPPPWKATR